MSFDSFTEFSVIVKEEVVKRLRIRAKSREEAFRVATAMLTERAIEGEHVGIGERSIEYIETP